MATKAEEISATPLRFRGCPINGHNSAPHSFSQASIGVKVLSIIYNIINSNGPSKKL